MIVEGWGCIAGFVSKATGRDVSAEAMRKLSERDSDLRKHITYLNKKPGISIHELDRWIVIATSRKRKRKAIRAAVAWVQGVLGLY